MNTLFTFVLANAVIATALFGAILLVRPLIRNPVVLHWLFVLVLIKLVTPPIWSPQWTLLPAAESNNPLAAGTPKLEATGSDFDTELAPYPAAASESSSVAFGASAEGPVIDSKAIAAAETKVDSPQPTALSRESSKAAPATWFPAFRFSPLGLLAVIWGAGTCFFWGLSMWRVFRFERCLRFVEAPPMEVQAMARELADQLGLRQSPDVLFAPGDVSPMLWAFFGRARILVPGELFRKLTDSARRSLLLHELVHYRRGDHWVRFLELAVVGVYWWFPVAWFVRREIRKAEELACDAEVVSRLPADRRAYAEMLVNVTALTSMRTAPALASGIGAKTQIEERVRTIMRSTFDVRVSSLVKAAVLIAAMVILPLAPMLVRAQRAEENAPTAKQEPAAPVVQESKAGASNKTAAAQKVDWLRGTGETLEIRIAGEIVDSSGKPVSDAKLSATVNGDTGPADLDIKQGAGRFEVWLPVGRSQRYGLSIHCESADRKQIAWRRIAQHQLRQAAIDGVKLTLAPYDRAIEIHVVHKGTPVEGAKVMINSLQRGVHTVTTDASGIARVGTTKGDKLMELTAWTQDHRIGGYQFHQQPTRDPLADRHTVELSACRPQKIRLIDEEKKAPAAGVRFRLQVATPNPFYNYIGVIPESTMTTDDKGEATFEWFPDWSSHHSYADGFDKEWIRIGSDADPIAADGAIEVPIKRIQIDNRKPIIGQVKSFDGVHGGYCVEIYSHQGPTEHRGDGFFAFTDAQGRFSGAVLPDATYCVFVVNERMVSEMIDLIPYDSKTQKVTEPVLTVVEGTPVEVLVSQGPNQAPMAGVGVAFRANHRFSWLDKGEKRNGSGSRDWWVTSDERGLAKTFALPGKPLEFSVYEPDWRLEKTGDVKAGLVNRFELNRPVVGRHKVSGQLFLPAELDAKLEGAEVVASALDGISRDENNAKVDAEGKFEFETSASVFGIYASTQDGKAAIAAVVEIGEVDRGLNLTLAPTGEYQGQILDEQGAPKVDYPVRASMGISSGRKSDAGGKTSLSTQVSSAKTDSAGNFTLTGIPYGVNVAIYSGLGSDNGRFPLDRLILDPGEKRPKAVHRLAVTVPGAPEKRPALKTQFENALRDAKLGGWRMMVVTYQGTPENREFVTQQLYNYDDNNDVSGFIHVFHRTTGDSVTPEDKAFAESMNWRAPGEGKIFACALDESGKELGRTELDINDTAAPGKATKFMHEFAPQPEDAKKKWDEAFALAAKTDRKVWVRVSQRFCGPCFVLSRWLDDQRTLIEKDYVLLKVCNVRDVGGSEVAARFWDWKSGNGVPFHAIFDPSGAKIIDSAGPLGNIGAPSGYEGGKHLRKMLMESRKNLTDDEIDKLIKSLPE